MTEKLKKNGKVLVTARVSATGAFTFLPANVLFNEKVVVFPEGTFSEFCMLQSRVHEIWAGTFSSTLKDDLQYTPTDCFETFPFPPDWESVPELEAAGVEYYDFRAGLMVGNDEGLTKTCNRFHDPDGTDAGIIRLRESRRRA
ncbi:MAG: hypothetical protein Q8O19_03990 [Rectinemataceae bacterium]|nr:hypothetical protein [Rectinemataceae bacterium]